MNKKHLVKVVDKAVSNSIGDGIIDTAKTSRFIKYFKQLPLNQSVVALERYAAGLKRVVNAQTLYVYSPERLSDSVLNQFKSQFKKNHFVTDTQLILDPSLLGGVMFKIGDNVFDNSIKSKIAQVKGVIRG